MTTVIREYLYLGDSESELKTNGLVKIILDLSEWKFDLEPMKNENDRLFIHELVSIITHCVDSEIPILVKCHGAMDRSPFIVACWVWFDYYCQDKEVSLLEAYEEVKRLHPPTIIHDDWMRWWLNYVDTLP